MTSPRILVVEDEAVFALGLRQRLQRLGHDVVGLASRADEACVLADRLRPDLVLMDVRLEGEKDGIDAGCVLRERLQVPVIYLSACDDDETRLRAGRSEAFGFLHKPCHDRELRSAIEMALQKHAGERRLRDSEQRSAATLASIGEGVLVVNARGQITFLNAAAEQLTGWRRDEALGQPLESVYPLRDARTGQPLPGSARRAMQEDQIVKSEPGTLLLSRHGREVLIDETAAPMREKGAPSGAVVTFRDQGGRRENESRLQKLQRLQALGVMAGGIALDFNNLLTPILAYAGLVRPHLPEGSPGLAMLDQIEASARRAAEITRQVLAFGGKGPATTCAVELSALVKEVAGVLRSSEYARARVHLQLADDLPPVEGDPEQLRQVLLNLLTNAVEALSPAAPESQGHIAVRTGRRRLTREKLRAEVTGEPLPEGDYVFVEILDTGCGMDAARLERIFEPFFSSKCEGRGLGLSAVLGVVRGHRGALFVHSVAGRGSTFEVLFRPCESAEPAPPSAMEGRQALVIDDEEGIPKLVGHCLRSIGLEVLAAHSGSAGVELLRRHRGRVAVALVDLQMPGDDGPATIRKLRAVEPSLPVILLSGCSAEEAQARCAGLRLEGVMQKPFNLSQLTRLVAKVTMQS